MLLPVALGLVLLVPPAHGMMLLVSTTGLSTSAIAERALAAGAHTVGPGPIAASLVVFGDRDTILANALSDGIIPIAVPIACGSHDAPSLHDMKGSH